MARPNILCPYEIGSKYPRGYGVIIVNSFKNDKEHERRGADVDEVNLYSLFRLLGLEIIVKRNISAAEIIKSLSEISKSNDLFNHTVLVVAISSHGTAKGLVGEDTADTVSEKEIISIFSSQDCPNLVGNPKIFIFNGCRIYEEETVQVVEARALQEKVYTDQQTMREQKRGTGSSDILKIYSCLEGFVSLRSNKRGSLFISTLCNYWGEYGNDKSLPDIVSYVNGDLTKTCGSCTALDSGNESDPPQCCYYDSTLTSELRLGAIHGNEEEEKELIQIDARKPPSSSSSKEPQSSSNIRRCNSFVKKNQRNKKARSTQSDIDKENKPMQPVCKDEYTMHIESPQIELEAKSAVEEPIAIPDIQTLNIQTEQLSEIQSQIETKFENPNTEKQLAIPYAEKVCQKPDSDSPSLPATDPTEFYLCGTAFDDINTVYIADGVNSRVWCCNITKHEFPGYLYDPVFELNQPYAVVADENFVIVTCGTTLLSFDAKTLCKVKQFKHKLANFSGIDVDQNSVYVASNCDTYSIYTGSYSLDMAEIALQTGGAELKPDLYLSDLKVILSSLILLFNDSTTPVCLFTKEGVFMTVVLQSPEVQRYRFFTTDHFNETVILGEENAGHIMILDLNKLVWTKYLYPRLVGLQLGGISLLSPDLLFVSVNTSKIPSDLSDQCMTLTL